MKGRSSIFRRRGKQPGLIRHALSLGYLFDGPQRLIVALDQESLADLHAVSGGDHFGANAAAGVFDIPVELIFTHLQLAALAYESAKGGDDLIGQIILIAAELIAVFRPLHRVFAQSRYLPRDQQTREFEAGVAQTNVRVGDLDDFVRHDASAVALTRSRPGSRICDSRDFDAGSSLRPATK